MTDATLAQLRESGDEDSDDAEAQAERPRKKTHLQEQEALKRDFISSAAKLSGSDSEQSQSVLLL